MKRQKKGLGARGHLHTAKHAQQETQGGPPAQWMPRLLFTPPMDTLTHTHTSSPTKKRMTTSLLIPARNRVLLFLSPTP